MYCLRAARGAGFERSRGEGHGQRRCGADGCGAAVPLSRERIALRWGLAGGAGGDAWDAAVRLLGGSRFGFGSGLFQEAFAGREATVCYAAKANSSLAILRMLAKLGAGFDIVSGGELERVRRAE